MHYMLSGPHHATSNSGLHRFTLQTLGWGNGFCSSLSAGCYPRWPFVDVSIILVISVLSHCLLFLHTLQVELHPGWNSISLCPELCRFWFWEINQEQLCWWPHSPLASTASATCSTSAALLFLASWPQCQLRPHRDASSLCRRMPLDNIMYSFKPLTGSCKMLLLPYSAGLLRL